MTDEPVDALEENLWSMWSTFGRGDGCVLVDEPHLLRFETPIPQIPYNAVMRCTVADPDLVDDVLGVYAARAVPIMWVVHPSAPDELPAVLASRGLVEAEVCPGMVAPLDSLPDPGPPPDGVRIAEIGIEDADRYIDLVAWRYSLPQHATPIFTSFMQAARVGAPDSTMHLYEACVGDRTVSKVAVHVGGGVLGVYGVATRPEARGLGLARWLTLHALRAGRGAAPAGIDTAILHSTPMAISLYEGMGFEQVADFRLWSTPDTVHL